MFISYSYDGDTKPDDVIPENLYAATPFEATGVVLFDVLIANCDRHGGNLKVDDPIDPSSFYLIDHERALFYIYKGKGIRRLESRKDRLGVTDGAESKGEHHCLVEQLDSVEHIHAWVRRIGDIPDWFLDGICDEARDLSLTKDECDAVKTFLKDRKTRIGRLILDNRSRFPRISTSDWPLVLGVPRQ